MADERKKQNSNLPNEADDSTEELTDNASVSIYEELAQSREKLVAKEKEAKEHYDRYLRQVAEVDNFKKRINREKEDAIRYGNEHLIKDILPVIDNLERAIAHAKDGGNDKPLVEGVEMVLKGLLDIFNKHGVVQIPSVGEIFDPGKHEAMAQIESDQHEPNTVIDEHHKGYLFRDRLLRPALVTVAKALTKGEENGENKVENGSTDD
ncbi:MAG: nucleotide exchange factor GrpE [Deltaproteobacteria bacterium]|nr:nucleotide exchange factor GrpE [Deltaproteobacteria bacterium]